MLVAAARLGCDLGAAGVRVYAADDIVDRRLEREGAHDESVCRPHFDIRDPVELHSPLRVEVDDPQTFEVQELAGHLHVPKVHVVDDRVKRIAFGG